MCVMYYGKVFNGMILFYGVMKERVIIIFNGIGYIKYGVFKLDV